MGLLDGPIKLMKALGRLLLSILLLPVRLVRGALGGATGIRGASAPSKAVGFLAIVLASVSGAGLLFAMTSSVETSASSAPVISAMLAWMTNGWGYVFAAIVFGRGTVWGLRKARIGQAARASGYSPGVLERLADEIRTTDGTTRAIIFGDDSIAEARKRILGTFDGTDDRIYLDAETDADGPADDAQDSAIAIPDPDRDQTNSADSGATDEESASRAERFKLWRMDLATGLRTDDVVWRLLVPTAVVFVIELVLVQFWVRWWLYPPMLAAALLAGLLTYQGGKTLRKRRLKRHRQERSGETWEEIGVLVKTVETDELTVHMGFLAGRSYASLDRRELAETLASRALERSHGYHPSPAIEERYAWCLDRYIANFAGWRENMEKPSIMDELVNQVLDAEEGMLPKEVLAHRVVEHDRRYIWQGLRFVGLGYDPDLVAECYEELVPCALVEHDLAVDGPGAGHQAVAVRPRTEALPPDVAQLRVNFSERFAPHQIPDRYSLPTVDPDEATRGFAIPGGAGDD